MMKDIYIILSRSQTIFAKAIRAFTKKYYSHTSISFDEGLDTFYSFGRRNPRLMFPAGFITEGVDKGFFAIHPSTEICVLKMPVTDEDYQTVKKKLQVFIDRPLKYKYNVKKMPLMMMGIVTRDETKYVCSVFVAQLLDHILDYKKDYSLVYPEDFLEFDFEIIYRGTAKNYAKQKLQR